MAVDKIHAEDKAVVERTGYYQAGVGVMNEVKRIGEGRSASVTVWTDAGDDYHGSRC